MALALEAAALIQSGNQGIADFFCAARLTENPGLCFGTLRSNNGVALLLIDLLAANWPASVNSVRQLLSWRRSNHTVYGDLEMQLFYICF